MTGTNPHRMNLVALGLMSYVAVFCAARFQGFSILTGAQFDFLPGLVVVAAMMHGVWAVLVVSITGGLLYDCLSANPVGVTTFVLAIVGTFVYINRDLLLRDQTYPQFILGAGASAAAPLLSYVVVSIMGRHPLVEWTSLWVWLVLTVTGGLLTPVWFVIFRKVDKALHYQDVPESSFRADREIERGRT
jgi:rod shape-determining protein MreD